jgi:hypothetical protein
MRLEVITELEHRVPRPRHERESQGKRDQEESDISEVKSHPQEQAAVEEKRGMVDGNTVKNMFTSGPA